MLHPNMTTCYIKCFFPNVCVPACIHKCVHALCVRVVEAKKGVKSPGSRAPGTCEPSGMGAGWERNLGSLKEWWVLSYHLFLPCIEYFKRKQFGKCHHIRRTSSALGIGWKTLVWQVRGAIPILREKGHLFLGRHIRQEEDLLSLSGNYALTFLLLLNDIPPRLCSSLPRRYPGLTTTLSFPVNSSMYYNKFYNYIYIVYSSQPVLLQRPQRRTQKIRRKWHIFPVLLSTWY